MSRNFIKSSIQDILLLTKIRSSKIIVPFILIFSIHTFLISQKTVTSELGFKLKINKEGKLETEPTEFSPYENPEFNFLLEEQDRININKIIAHYKAEDLKLFEIKRNLESSINDTKIFHDSLQTIKKEEQSTPLQNEYKVTKKQINKLYKNLNEQYQNFNKIYTSRDKKKIQHLLIKELQKISVISGGNEPLERTETEAVSYENTAQKYSLITPDETKPWKSASLYTDNLFFIYTPDKMKNYYKDEPMLKGFAQLVKKNNDFEVTIELRFSSSDIIKSYGFIKENDFLKLNMLYGEAIFLLAAKNSFGELEPGTGHTIYKASFKIKNKSDLKKIGDGYVDSLGIMWSSGFEYYPVYKLDLLAIQYLKIKK